MADDTSLHTLTSVVRFEVRLPDFVTAEEHSSLTTNVVRAVDGVYDRISAIAPAVDLHDAVRMARARYGSPWSLDFAIIGADLTTLTILVRGLSAAVKNLAEAEKLRAEAAQIRLQVEALEGEERPFSEPDEIENYHRDERVSDVALQEIGANNLPQKEWKHWSIQALKALNRWNFSVSIERKGSD